MLKETLKRNKGITLIALVVTIIVLLILAGISINMLTADNGIIKKALEAKQKTEAAQEEENRILKEYEDLMKKYGSGSTGGEGTGGEGSGGEGSGGEGSGGEGSGSADKKLPTGEGTTPYLPSNDFSYKEGDLDNGLVIKDSAGNEYVWVEVPKTSKVYPNAGTKITSFTDTDYETIDQDLHTYTNVYRNGTNYIDIYYKDTSKGWFTDEGDTSYNKAKQKMLKSVYEHGGFWVGRYEAGIEKEADIRKEETDTVTLTPVTKQNMYPYNYVKRTQAKVLAEQVESGNCTSSLMFGVQWDLVLKYIEIKGNVNSADLKSDSTLKGNYANNKWNITNVKAKYSTDSGQSFTACPYPKKSTSEAVLLTTGADESFSMMNIYDIAGNVEEWTLEKTSNDYYPCAYRGGEYSSGGSNYPASSRNNVGTSGSVNYIGFRLSLY